MPGEFVESKIKYYKMRREIYAKGGGGEVHLGVGDEIGDQLYVDPVSKQVVAIKKGYSKNRNRYGVSPTLIREIGMLKELMVYHHPNIVNVLFIFKYHPTAHRCVSSRR